MIYSNHLGKGVQSDEVRKSNHSIPWRLVIATRNQLIHGYLGIDNDTLWSIIKDDREKGSVPLLSIGIENPRKT